MPATRENTRQLLALQQKHVKTALPARTIHSLENQSVLIVQQASIIHRLLNSAVLIVQQASFQKLQGEHSVPYVKTVQKARFLRQVQVSVILASLARTIHRLDNQSV